LGDADPDNLANWNPLLTADEYDVARRELAAVEGMKLIACAPGCKMQANDWGRANWRDLLARLYQRYPSFALVMIGAKEDEADCTFAASAWGGVKLNLAGSLTPRQSAAALAHASVFIGHDSGPNHLRPAWEFLVFVSFPVGACPAFGILPVCETRSSTTRRNARAVDWKPV
jgi:ADP-heptose:LPS heptosyltransferase